MTLPNSNGLPPADWLEQACKALGKNARVRSHYGPGKTWLESARDNPQTKRKSKDMIYSAEDTKTLNIKLMRKLQLNGVDAKLITQDGLQYIKLFNGDTYLDSDHTFIDLVEELLQGTGENLLP